ncbi:sulfurtransferase [Cloacibacterium rupense]|uniref:Sulfurtransferase n=1 Tax=Cloacibacterium rupense TaxID=517423 RepID=A0ABQ2NIU4_9FLAO|nr:sulfurtransferase [Cloacibacterium rupense]GGP03306.1 sulfurtransferase [Cloacibacterium rupense]
MKPIITSTELLEIFNQENLVILDSRTGNKAKENYLDNHLKGARFIDLDKDLAEIGENAAFGGRHPLPKISNFAETLQNLGISEDSHIVVYDLANGGNAAARCWWMLRAFGIEKVQVLSGGFQAAEKAGIPTNSREEIFEKASFVLRENWSLPTSTLENVEKEIAKNSATVIDVRDAYRYRGESEPIDLVAGHIPGAINIPFSENLDENGEFLSPKILKEKYQNLLSDASTSLSMTKKLIIHCGSGVTACHTILALDYAGFPIPNLYVGSWSEWSRREGKEIAREV